MSYFMTDTKTCNKCKLTLDYSYYYKHKARKDGLQVYCKKCMTKTNANSYIEHKISRDEKSKEYSKTEKCKEYRRNWAKNKYHNDEEHRQKCIKLAVDRERYLLETDPEFKLKHSLRTRFRTELKKKNCNKTNDVFTLTGCSIPFLKEHLEQQFKQGMTWDNHTTDGWHIDHIRPCCSFDLTKKEQQEECFHYSNLQPLWATDNLKKGGKTDYIILQK